MVRGDTIRLWARDRELPRATYLHTDSAWLYQRPLATGDTQRVARSEISRAEVLRGSHRAGLASVGHGALIGGAVGFMAGTVAAVGSNSSQKEEIISPVVAIAATTVVGAAIGTVVGAMMAFRTVDEWSTFDLAAPDSARVSDARVMTSGDSASRAGRAALRVTDTLPSLHAQRPAWATVALPVADVR